jgi:hypothetical protein
MNRPKIEDFKPKYTKGLFGIVTVAMQYVKALEHYADSLEQEIEVTDHLLSESNRVIDSVPSCESHGRFIPHAIDWINSKKDSTVNVLNVDWRKVDEELPKNVTAVLIYSECCEVCSYMQIAEIEDGKWFVSGSGEDVNVEPTHWAELPKPPVSEDERIRKIENRLEFDLLFGKAEFKLGDTIEWSFADDDTTIFKGKTFQGKISSINKGHKCYAVYCEYGVDMIPFNQCKLIKSN